MVTHVKVLGVLYIALSAIGLSAALFLMLAVGTASSIVGVSADPGDAAVALPIIGLAGSALVIFLLANTMPQEALVYPLYYMSKEVHLYDTRVVVIIIFAVIQSAFGTYLLSSVLSAFPREILEAAQPGQRLGDLAAGLVQDLGEVLRLRHRGLDLVEAEVVGDLLGEVDDVVERRGEQDDVLTVDRRHERVVEPVDQVMGDPVAVLLADQDVAREVLLLGVAAQHLVEQVGSAHDVGGGFLEEVEELAVLRHEHLGKTGHGRHHADAGVPMM